jgi:hypothetical protein
MPKRTPPPRRPPLQGPTTSPAFASRIRTAQQRPNMAMTRGLDALLPGVGTMVGAAMVKRGKRQERGR